RRAPGRRGTPRRRCRGRRCRYCWSWPWRHTFRTPRGRNGRVASMRRLPRVEDNPRMCWAQWISGSERWLLVRNRTADRPHNLRGVGPAVPGAVAQSAMLGVPSVADVGAVPRGGRPVPAGTAVLRGFLLASAGLGVHGWGVVGERAGGFGDQTGGGVARGVVRSVDPGV